MNTWHEVQNEATANELFPSREIEVTNDWRLEMLWTRCRGTEDGRKEGGPRIVFSLSRRPHRSRGRIV